MAKDLKTIAVGDGAVGKTSMLITFVKKEFPEEYIPTVFDNHAHNMYLMDNTPVRLGLWDTGGGEDYGRLRPLSYPQTDVFILCFCVEREYALRNITEKWYPELKFHCPEVPVILVATKIDLRDSEDKTVTKEEGEAVAEQIKAAKYMEISSKRQEGLTELFDEVARIGYEFNTTRATKKKSRKCRIL